MAAEGAARVRHRVTEWAAMKAVVALDRSGAGCANGDLIEPAEEATAA
ncbi:hypothetical protein J7F03_22215 [Streptomyces sp. ISL-43]|nr:hypothetical protein [Streptomyces sp. ISL-43]MBT2449743.1 hypothetical protein [Streptomyces sp. ISL-43]